MFGEEKGHFQCPPVDSFQNSVFNSAETFVQLIMQILILDRLSSVSIVARTIPSNWNVVDCILLRYIIITIVFEINKIFCINNYGTIVRSSKFRIDISVVRIFPLVI